MKAFFGLPIFLRIPFFISLLATVVNSLLVLTFYFRIQPVIPFFFTRANPADYLVTKEWLFFFPTFSAAITVIHTLIARVVLKNSEKMLLQLFSWFTVLLQLLLTLILIRTLVLVT